MGGAASRRGGTGPSQDEADDEGYPVNSSCPSTSRALSIPHIREKIFNFATSPEDMSSFCKLRAVGRAWQETGFHLMKNQNMPQFWLSLSKTVHGHDDYFKTKNFMKKVTPDALLPLVPIFNVSHIDVPLATRLAQDYSHIFVGLELSIQEEAGGDLSNLDKKLELFQGRELCSLQTVKLSLQAVPSFVVGGQLAPAKELQKVLDAIDRLTGSLKKLTELTVIIMWDFAREDELLLPSLVTQLFLRGCNSLQAVARPRQTFPRLEVLSVRLQKTDPEPQTNLGNILERSPNLENVRISGMVPPLSEASLPLPLPQLNSVTRISLEGLNYTVKTTSGSDVLPFLTKAILTIDLGLKEGEVTRLAVLGRLLRKASRFTLNVSTSQISLPRMEPLSACFSNVTQLESTSYSEWEGLVESLSHVFLRMTCLQDIEIMSSAWKHDKPPAPLDLCRLLTGLQESEILENEKATILNGRRDVLTNLRRLRRLEIRTEYKLQPLSPFLFEAVFNSMPELTAIRLRSFSMFRADPFVNVQKMVKAWRASGRQFN